MKQGIVRTKSKPAVAPTASLKRKRVLAKTPAIPSRVPFAVGTKLKFRAECELDANLFMYVIPEFVQQPWSTVTEFGQPEVTFRLKKELSLNDLRWIASAIPDAHVIAQSLSLSDDYSGKRDLSVDIDVNDKAQAPPPEILSRIVLYARNFAMFSKNQAQAAKELSSEFDALYIASEYPKSLLKS